MNQKKQVAFNQRIQKFFTWPLFYMVVITFMTIVMLIIEKSMGIFFIILWMIAGVTGYFMNKITKKHLMSEVINFALSFSGVQKDYLDKLELPNVILDPEAKIRWCNEAFNILVGTMEDVDESKIIEMNINDIIPSLNREMLPSEMEGQIEKVFEIGERHYRVIAKHMRIEMHSKELDLVNLTEDEEQLLYTLYFFDITKELMLEQKNIDQKTVAALIYIDNYEEVLSSIEDVRRPLLVALIDRNLSKFANKIDGVLKKFEKDQYILVFQQKYMEELKSNKFSILDEIRSINIGNELPVTMSMGIGINEFSYIQSVEFGRMALDLALGRGGDQAVVKKNDKFSFYGGKTRGVEKSTRVKARIKAYAFRELIEESDRVIIMGHKRQDLDSLGAAVGIYACAKLLDKPANIVINDVTSSVKTLHTQLIENDHYPKNLFVTGQEAISYIKEKTLLVVVDVNRPSYTEHMELLDYFKNIVVFDHHRVSSEPIENPVLSYIESYASSTCEMVTEILRYISDKVKLEPIEADALFAGITVDTKNFVIKTGVKTFEAAAFLKRSGADVIRVRGFFKNDMASYKAKATAVRDCQIYSDHMAISVCPSDVENPSLVAAQAADELLNISDIKASFVLSDIEGTIYISARSYDSINVQLIMEKLGGGGHLSVAGAQIPDETIEGVILKLKEALDNYTEEGETT
ncbi:DHH family phosphoesterase [Petrocella sp. FN5]|uniref:DHH family phosphoesterase n=1 Tax=Petrocella sp. FN5 TaxID=3032002 RepID=UPI0023DB0FD6|nr:DHH family phosphoesterase [Petrocella sp. FN5]MDF1618224.1 DHH family phosphoesterase [Petrocella sp. FN5]